VQTFISMLAFPVAICITVFHDCWVAD